MGVAMQRLMGMFFQGRDRGNQAVAQQVQRGRREEPAPVEGFQQAGALGENRQRRQRPGERTQVMMALMEACTDRRRLGSALDRRDELSEIERVTEVFVRTGRQIGMHGDDRSPLPGEVRGDRVFPLEPGTSPARAVQILHHPRHQRFRQPEHERVAILQDLAAVRCHSMGKRRLGGRADWQIGIQHRFFRGRNLLLSTAAPRRKRLAPWKPRAIRPGAVRLHEPASRSEAMKGRRRPEEREDA